MVKVASYQLHFLPHAYIVARYLQGDKAVLTVDVDFDRNHWVHRCELPDGEKLTLPIKRSAPGRKETIAQKLITYSDEGAYDRILPRLKEVYGHLPHFQEPFEIVSAFMNDRPMYLWFLNFSILTQFLDRMGIDPRGRIIVSSSLELTQKKSWRVIELCKKLDADEYVCGRTAYDSYLEHDAFEKSGIKLTVQDWKGPNVNIFELVATHGWDEAKRLLLNNN